MTVGSATSHAGAGYPPEVGRHPPSYRSVALSGRSLEEWQIVFIERGEGFISVDSGAKNQRRSSLLSKHRSSYSTRQPVSAGDALILRPDEWHRYRPDATTGWHEYWVGFSGAFLDLAANGLGLLAAPVVVHQGAPDSILSLFHSLLSLAERNELSTHIEMISIILEMLVVVSRSVNRGSASSYSPEILNATAHMAAFLNAPSAESFSVDATARGVGMSPSAFRKRFFAELGMTPYHYFTMLRVNEVKMQLAHSDKPLREIADRFGFTDQYHLSRVFKQYVGASPTAWRRRGEP